MRLNGALDCYLFRFVRLNGNTSILAVEVIGPLSDAWSQLSCRSYLGVFQGTFVFRCLDPICYVCCFGPGHQRH